MGRVAPVLHVDVEPEIWRQFGAERADQVWSSERRAWDTERQPSGDAAAAAAAPGTQFQTLVKHGHVARLDVSIP